MLRGEVWWVDFDPTVGEEITKLRPAVIVSSDRSNDTANRLQVVPFTRSLSRVYPSEASVSLNGETVKAVADQLRTVSKLRLRNRAGIMSGEDMGRIENAIRRQLNLL